MKKKGKGLEIVIKLIEETLKNSPHTVVHSNYKIKNCGNRYREFDVFIESNINGYVINIAIECKDYKNPVPAKEIEAFETKCNRIKTIHKKVFVSSNGFQAEAINVAKDCGIELQIASKLKPNQILHWFPIKNLNIRLAPGGSADVRLNVDDSYFDKADKLPNGIFLKDGNAILLNSFILDRYHVNRHEINEFALLEWMKLSQEKQEEPFPIGLNFETPDLLYIDKFDTQHIVTNIKVILNIQFEQTLIQPSESTTLTDLNGNLKAETITINLDDGTTTNFIRTADNKTSIQLNGPDGVLKHMRVIAFYDPKTNLLKKK